MRAAEGLLSSGTDPIVRLRHSRYSLPFEPKDDNMKRMESFANAVYDDEMHLAERELSAFIAAVIELYGPDEAKVSTQSSGSTSPC